MESPRSVAAIPSITELRKKLDYGNPSLPRTQTFHDDMRIFRGRFTCSRSRLGTSFIEWKSFDDQRGLQEMTTAYLDHEGNGPLFWPEDPASPRYNKLRYSDHRLQIGKLVKQLFFRLNLQQHRNLTYRHKKSDVSRSFREGSKENPINLNEAEAHTPTESATPSSPSYHQIGFVVQPEALQTGVVDPALEVGGAKPNSGPGRDPYSVPKSPTQAAADRQNTFPTSTFNSTASQDAPDKPPPLDADAGDAARPFKRIKIVCSTATTRRGRTRGKRGRPATDRTLRSPRARRTRRNPNQANEADLDAALASPTLPESPSDVSHSTTADTASARATANRPSPAEQNPTVQTPGVQADHATATLFDETVERFLEQHAPYAQMATSPHHHATMSATLFGRISTPINTETHQTDPGRAQTEYSDGAATSSVPATPVTAEVFPEAAEQQSLSRKLTPPRPKPPPLPPVQESKFISSSPPSAPPSVTSSSQPQQPVSRPQSPSPPPAPSIPLPPKKPTVAFRYLLIQSREPDYLEVNWVPTGRFREKTVAELEDEMPIELPTDAKGWLFTLRGPGVQATFNVRRGQQDDFNDTMAHFDSLMRRVIPKNIDQGRLVFKLEIEAWTGNGALPAKKVENYEGEIDDW